MCKPQVVFYFQPYSNRTQSYWELLDSHKRYSVHGFEFLHFFCRLVRRKYRSPQLFTILLYSTCLFISVSQWHLCCIRMQPPGAALWAWGHSSRSPWECKLQLVSWCPGCCLETWENSSCSLCSVTVLAEGVSLKTGILQKWILWRFPPREFSSLSSYLLDCRQTCSSPLVLNLFHSYSGNAMLKGPFLSWLVFYNKQSQPPSVPSFFEWKLFCVGFNAATDGRCFLRLRFDLKWLSAIKMQCVGLYGSSGSVCAINTGPHGKFLRSYSLWLHKVFCRKRTKNWKIWNVVDELLSKYCLG